MKLRRCILSSGLLLLAVLTLTPAPDLVVKFFF